MSKHWKPQRRGDGWAGQWDRHRWPMPKRRLRFTGGEIRLVLLGGIAAGLAVARSPELFAATPRAPQQQAAWHGESVRIVDGDTFWYRGVKIRVADIDAPEVHGRCAYETDLAARATMRMAALLAQGPFELQPIDRDEDIYGRKLRVVTRRGRSLGDQLVSEGLARTWTGHREPWC